jgi:Tfp pilus assembly protein PilX
MPWLYLLLALAAFAVAFKTTSVAVLVISLLLALGLLLAWVLALLAQRIGSRSRDTSMMIDATELRRLREQAEARRNSGQPPPSPPAT